MNVHELGLCASIVDAVERRAGERPVAGLRVRVGCLHHIHPDAFEQSFAVAAMGTVAAQARAELVLIPVQVRCHTCNHVWESTELPTGCPRCASVELTVSGGDDLVLESIEYKA